VVNEYKKRRKVIVEVLSKIPGVEFKEPEGAFYIIAKLPVDDAEKFAKWLLTDFNYQRKTIMIAPGSGFYATEGLGKKEIRIAWILNRKDLAAAMGILKRGLEEYRKLIK
ncbi:MAG: pyridoxal phosphate-dependent aminotransferase, partial [Patescibacteria group bacterium]|nr:pyridoxal phosphate-dependent aminotransferase [Patescibacteria group bacterium]